MSLSPNDLFRALVELDEELPDSTPLTEPATPEPADRLIRLLDRLGHPANDSPPAAGAAETTPPHEPASAPTAAPETTPKTAPPGAVYQRLRDLVRGYDALTERYHADFDQLFSSERIDPERAGLLSANSAEDDEALLARLRSAQVLLLKYPIAAQALVAALVAEGRRFGATPEGARWKQSLAGSDLLRRGRAVWEAATLRAFDGEPTGPLPSTYIDAFARACQRGDLEPLLARLFFHEGNDGDDGGG